MKQNRIYILSTLLCIFAVPAMAGWQYPGTYVGDGWYADDGSRFIISVRGGASIGRGDVKNSAGAISIGYYVDPERTQIATEGYCEVTGACSGWDYAGYLDMDTVPVTKDLETFSFAAGASIGWTIPNRPQWRLEAGWDHITKSDYNASPLFAGDMTLVGGDIPEQVSAYIESGSVNSQISTDIISAMAFYDFFEGTFKPTNQIIPYVGFGMGYADTRTVLNLSDPYGDLSDQSELEPFGEFNENGILRFYKSERSTTNVAWLASVGASYGLTDQAFLDFGLRVAYLPEVKWGLRNEDDTRHREWFRAENIFYTNIMMGVRFEF